MSLQFADFDADGHQDIVTATFEGHAFVVRGGASGWQLPEHITDREGRNVVLSLYYDMEAHEYKNADRSPEGVSNPEDHCVSAMVMDYDADGDLDLLLGAKEGRLYLQRNEGKRGEARFTGINELLELEDGSEFNVPGGLTAARVVDWDRDGLDDLVCGSFEGGAYLYRNVGEASAPLFGLPVTLAKPGGAGENGAGGPESDWYVDPVDYDGDGDLDLLVGGHFMSSPPERVLTESEEAELAELEALQRELNERFSAAYEELQEEHEGDQDAFNEAWKALYETKEFQELSKQMRETGQKIGELRPRPQRTSGVWLYRRTPQDS